MAEAEKDKGLSAGDCRQYSIALAFGFGSQKLVALWPLVAIVRVVWWPGWVTVEKI